MEVNAALHYNNRDGVIHACTYYACFIKVNVLAPSSAYSSTTVTYAFSCSVCLYLCVPCYSGGCLGLVWRQHGALMVRFLGGSLRLNKRAANDIFSGWISRSRSQLLKKTLTFELKEPMSANKSEWNHLVSAWHCFADGAFLGKFAFGSGTASSHGSFLGDWAALFRISTAHFNKRKGLEKVAQKLSVPLLTRTVCCGR